jgi:hypothetical protein
MSPILERKSGKFVAKKEVCFLGKKEKKAAFKREKKQKEWNKLHFLVRFC